MTTIEEILKKYFNCPVPFRNDGHLTTTGRDAMKKLDELLSDLQSVNAIPKVNDAHSVIWELVDEMLENKVITPILKRVLDEGRDIKLKNPPTLTTVDGEMFRCLYIGKLERSYVVGYDLICLDAKWPESSDDDYSGSIWSASNLTEDSLFLLKKSFDGTD